MDLKLFTDLIEPFGKIACKVHDWATKGESTKVESETVYLSEDIAKVKGGPMRSRWELKTSY
jgi:hypothetical protein